MNLSFNARHRLIAVGTRSGMVHVFSLNDKSRLLFSHQISTVGQEPSSLSWSRDGSVLAVGTLNSCFVYTLFGHQVFQTTASVCDLVIIIDLP